MWQLHSGLLRQLEIIIASVSSCNIFLIVASFGFGMGSQTWMDSNLLLLPQVLVNLYTLFYSYFKYTFLYKWILQLLMSLILAGIFIFFTAKVFPLANEDSGQFLIRVVEGTNVFLAFMLVVESTMAVVVVRREKIDRPLDDVPTSRGNAGATENSANGIQEPPQIHIYQPRLDLPPSGQRGRGSSALSGESTTGAAQSSADQSYRINILEREDSIGNEGLELELLPKYQRRRPAQSVTIVDLSNLQGVDPAVLNSVLGESVHEIQGQAQQNGQHIVCVEALDMAEAPAYSPPLTSSGGSRITNDTPNVTEGTAEEPSTLQLSPPLSSAEADTPLSTPNTATVTSSIHVSVPLATALYEPPTYMP